MNFRTFQKRNLADSKDDVASGIRDLLSSAEDLLRSTASYGGSEVESARSKLKRQLDSARQHARDCEQSALERYRRVSEATESYVHENPWKTIGIAAAVGLVIGTCMMVSSSRRR